MTHINDRLRRDQWRVTKSKSRKSDLSPEASTNTDPYTEGPVHIRPAVVQQFSDCAKCPSQPSVFLHIYFFMCVPVRTPLCHSTCMKVGGQLVGVSSLLSQCGF